MRVGIVGQTTVDVITEPDGTTTHRAGGSPVFAAPALRAAGFEPVVVTKGRLACGDVVLPAAATCVSVLDRSPGGVRHRIDAVGEPFTAAEASAAILPALHGCHWVALGGQTAGDFPPETIAALAGAGLRVLIDAQGLARGAAPGPVRLRPFAASAVAGATAIKLNEAEAAAVRGGAAGPPPMGVPEVLVTLGAAGSLVITGEGSTRVAPDGAGYRDALGAGDAWCALYAAGRSAGRAAVDAARFATARLDRLRGA